MQAIVNNEIHEATYYEGGWVDTACGERVHGRRRRKYEIGHGRKLTCPKCKAYKESGEVFLHPPENV